MSIYKRLSLVEVKPTSVKLQLADRSYIFPKGKIRNTLVKVDKFTFIVDFVIIRHVGGQGCPNHHGHTYNNPAQSEN